MMEQISLFYGFYNSIFFHHIIVMSINSLINLFTYYFTIKTLHRIIEHKMLL